MTDAIHDADPVPQVLTEIQSGGGLSLSAAGRMFPGHRGGPSVDPSTVWRWARKGARAAGGQLIRLEVCRVGSRWLTSRGAVARFVCALTSAADPTSTDPTPTARTPAACRRASERAVAKLKSMGA